MSTAERSGSDALVSCFRCRLRKLTSSINHPIAVANFLSSTGVTDVRVLQSAILHDTVEDTCTTVGELHQTAEEQWLINRGACR